MLILMVRMKMTTMMMMMMMTKRMIMLMMMMMVKRMIIMMKKGQVGAGANLGFAPASTLGKGARS